MSICACPTGPGRTITAPAVHEAWHRLVHEQTGIPLSASVDAHTLRAARGMKTEAPDMHCIREKHLRQGKSSPGWRREASR